MNLEPAPESINTCPVAYATAPADPGTPYMMPSSFLVFMTSFQSSLGTSSRKCSFSRSMDSRLSLNTKTYLFTIFLRNNVVRDQRHCTCGNVYDNCLRQAVF